MRISIERTKKAFLAKAFEAEREVASGAGDTPQEAAIWLLRHLHQITARCTGLVVELGLASRDDAAAAAHQPRSETP